MRVSLAPESVGVIEALRSPYVSLLWHNQLFLALSLRNLRKSDQGLYALVSASRDGAWLAALLSDLKISTIRGSSSRFGREAMNSLIEVLRAGNDAVITPDGPRGPAYSLEGGAIVAARRTGADVILVGCVIDSAWRLNAWDGFFIPKPFSKIELRADRISEAQLREMEQPISEVRERLYRLSVEHNESKHPAPSKFRRNLPDRQINPVDREKLSGPKTHS